MLIAADSINEVSIGLGRRLQVPQISDRNVYVTASTLRGLHIEEGE